MGGETGHEGGLMTQKRKLAGGKMPAWICEWTMFTVGTIYKGLRTVFLIATGFCTFLPTVCK